MVDRVEASLLRRTKAGKRLRLLKVESTENGDLKAKFAFLVSQLSAIFVMRQKNSQMR